MISRPDNPTNDASAAPRWTAWALVVSVLLGTGWLAWRCQRDAGLRFLPGPAAAQWILYPTGPDATAHPTVKAGRELPGVFRREVILDRAPVQARMQVRALENFGVSINGQSLKPILPVALNWKDTAEFDAHPQLRAGTNLIELTVTNRAGPPVMWLALKADGHELVSDEAWQVSYAGATWQPARRATTPPPLRPGNPMFEEQSVLDFFQRKLWTHGIFLFFAVSLAVRLRGRKAEGKGGLTAREAVRFTLGGLTVL